MFDLVNAIKQSTGTGLGDSFKSALFYADSEVRELIEQAYRFEGTSTVDSQSYSREAVVELAQGDLPNLIILDLSKVDDVRAEASVLRQFVTNDIAVLVLGREDSITTVRELNALGFYYLFYPVAVEEVVSVVAKIKQESVEENTFAARREAKRIAVIGAKGGAGATLITAAIARELVEVRKSRCLIVDHRFRGGNLDIMLGLKGFERDAVPKSALTNTIDENYAMGMTKQVLKDLQLLSVGAKDISFEECREYLRQLVENLRYSSNFILEDMSSANFSHDEAVYIDRNVDMLLLVVEPTVSGLRESAQIVTAIRDLAGITQLRAVINYNRPDKSATVTPEEVESYLGVKVDSVLPYDPKLNREVLKGEGLKKSKSGFATEIRKIASLLLGEKLVTKKKRLLGRKK